MARAFPILRAMRSASRSPASASATLSTRPASESALRPRVSAALAARRASATHVAVYVFVAAIDRSGPHRKRKVSAAVRAKSDRAWLVIATVGAREARASAKTAATSGAAPDWLIPITAPRAKLGGGR